MAPKRQFGKYFFIETTSQMRARIREDASKHVPNGQCDVRKKHDGMDKSQRDSHGSHVWQGKSGKGEGMQADACQRSERVQSLTLPHPSSGEANIERKEPMLQEPRSLQSSRSGRKWCLMNGPLPKAGRGGLSLSCS